MLLPGEAGPAVITEEGDVLHGADLHLPGQHLPDRLQHILGSDNGHPQSILISGL